MSAFDASQQPMQRIEGESASSVAPEIFPTPTAPVRQAPPDVELPPAKHAKPNTANKKKISNSDVIQAGASTQLTYLEPVFMRPAQHRVLEFIEVVADSMRPYVPKQNQAPLLEDLKKVYAYNLVSRCRSTLEEYVPQGFKRINETVFVPWSLARLIDSQMAYEAEKGVAPPLLPDLPWILTQLNRFGIRPPNARELNEMLARWQQNEKVMEREYPNSFVKTSGSSLLFAGVTWMDVANTRMYYPVSRTRLTRMEELLVGFIRPRSFSEIGAGAYTPSLVVSEARSLPTLCCYHKSAEAFDEDKFILEYIRSSFRRA